MLINYNTKTKRTKKNWTDEEVEFLKLGIKKYKGELNMWSKILKSYDFNDRTTTDLKDKHRNVTKKTSYHKHTNKPFCLVDDKGEPVKNYNGDVLTYYQKFPYDAAVRIANYNNMKNDLDFNVCILGSKYPIYTYTAISQENGSVIIRAKKATYK
ncbi:Telomeric repeat-binding factor [Binucleata daphniae]